MTPSHAEVGVVLARAGIIDVGLQQVSFSWDWSRLKDIFSKRMLYLNSSALLDILITKVMLLWRCDELSYFHITFFIHNMYVSISWVILWKEILLSVTMFFPACCKSMLCTYSVHSKDNSATFWSNVMNVLKPGIKAIYKRTFSPP